MTSNQLAMNANAETMRHNAKVEDENFRHNAALEEIQNKANEIESIKNQWLDERERAKLDWQKEYDSKFLEMQKTQGDRKLDIEEYLAILKQQDQDAQAAYRDRMASASEQANNLQQLRDAEIARHNLELEQIQSREVAAQEYRNTLTKEQNEINQFGVYSNYVLGLRNVGLQSRDVYTREQAEQRNREYQEATLGLYTKQMKSNIVSNYINSASSLVRSGTELVNTFNKSQGGKYGSKTSAELAKLAAESLFTD